MHKFFSTASDHASGTFGAAARVRKPARLLAALLFTILLLSPGRALSAPSADFYSLNLVWDASPSPEVVSYMVYYGAASGDYTNSIALGNVTTVTLPGLASGITYYFAITALDAFGVESGFSNEISYGQGAARLQINFLASGQFVLAVNGLTGHSYDIEATENFADWAVIGNVTVGVSGSLDFTDPNAADFPERFYRTRDLQP